MLPPDQHAALIEKAWQLIRAGGMFLIRVHVATPPVFSSPAALFQSYRSRNTAESAWTATRTHLDMLWLELGKRLIDFESYNHRIVDLHSQGVITDVEFDSYNRLSAYNRIKLYYTSSSDFEYLSKGRFDIVAVHVANDYTSAENHPIYELRRRA